MRSEKLTKNHISTITLSPLVEASNAQSGPFALEVAGKQLVSYDDVESVRRKAEYVKAEGLAGASLSTLDLDDFNNLCCQVRGPVIFSALQESIVRHRIRVKIACACTKCKILLISYLV
jgi:chitinase